MGRDDIERRRKKKKHKKRKKAAILSGALSFGDEMEEGEEVFKVRKKARNRVVDGGLSFVKHESRMTEEEALVGVEGEKTDKKPIRQQPEETKNDVEEKGGQVEPADPNPNPTETASGEADYRKYMRYFKKDSVSKEEEGPKGEGSAEAKVEAASQADEIVATQETPIKILVSGDVKGKFNKLFSSAARFEEKVGPFGALFCVGDFFAEDGSIGELEPYLKGQKTLPLDTYFVAGKETGQGANLLKMERSKEKRLSKQEKKDDVDVSPVARSSPMVKICDKLWYLGRKGRVDIAGLSVGYLSGRFHAQFFPDPPDKEEELKGYVPWYCEDHLDDILDLTGGGPEALKAGDPLQKGIDILLTSEWPSFDFEAPPASLPEFIKSDKKRLMELGSPAVGALVGGIASRYHFAASEDIYFAMPAYRNKSHSTRFYALASVGNTNKEKSMKAFNVVPLRQMSLQLLKQHQQTADGSPFVTEATPEDLKAPPSSQTAGPAQAPVSKGPQISRENASVFHNGLCKSHEVYGDGRWKCAFCGNVNYARQNKQCNMRKCNAPAPPCLRPTDKKAAKDKSDLNEEDDDKPKTKRRSKKESIYFSQRPKKRRGPKNE
ncbi:hypothetical protein AAMO2058_001489500 [Amorphochlora amoebiformis]